MSIKSSKSLLVPHYSSEIPVRAKTWAVGNAVLSSNTFCYFLCIFKGKGRSEVYISICEVGVCGLY